ncbi:hypothetical protein CYMTET_11159 [Cymbomonas tetramitiformis]|uniref:Uncharacterized protein n=1 Tax=Cymbomonas tetramitiformis TaxID=36881 RepID=A0AAE0LDF6_9CHLO|nr:hypothetical protein CYMTET_11159 [Cymbomonas tetramitiformis]
MYGDRIGDPAVRSHYRRPLTVATTPSSSDGIYGNVIRTLSDAADTVFHFASLIRYSTGSFGNEYSGQ